MSPVSMHLLWKIGKRLPLVALLACVASSSASQETDSFPAIPDPLAPVREASSGALLSFDTPVGEVAYRTARGFRIGDTGLNVGGFGTVEMDRTEGSPFEIQLDSISFLLLYEPIESFRAFAELEIGDIFDYEAQGSVESDVSFEVERLYGEVSLGDPVGFRFGKFQTPIGRWNLVPAEPFTWTASDPVLIDAAFDEHQTGLALIGATFPESGALEYWLYGQVVDPLDPSETPTPANRSIGSRLQYSRSLEHWSLGASFLAIEKRGEWSFLGGLDAEAQLGDFGLLAEFVYQNGAIGRRDMLGLFVQGRYELVRDVNLVARYEYFNRIGSKATAAHISDLGFAWQPAPWLILKATYRFSTRENDDVDRGLSSSISVVF